MRCGVDEPPRQCGLALPESQHSGDGGKRSRNLSLAWATRVKNLKIGLVDGLVGKVLTLQTGPQSPKPTSQN